MFNLLLQIFYNFKGADIVLKGLFLGNLPATECLMRATQLFKRRATQHVKSSLDV